MFSYTPWFRIQDMSRGAVGLLKPLVSSRLLTITQLKFGTLKVMSRSSPCLGTLIPWAAAVGPLTDRSLHQLQWTKPSKFGTPTLTLSSTLCPCTRIWSVFVVGRLTGSASHLLQQIKQSKCQISTPFTVSLKWWHKTLKGNQQLKLRVSQISKLYQVRRNHPPLWWNRRHNLIMIIFISNEEIIYSALLVTYIFFQVLSLNFVNFIFHLFIHLLIFP